MWWWWGGGGAALSCATCFSALEKGRVGAGGAWAMFVHSRRTAFSAPWSAVGGRRPPIVHGARWRHRCSPVRIGGLAEAGGCEGCGWLVEFGLLLYY